MESLHKALERLNKKVILSWASIHCCFKKFKTNTPISWCSTSNCNLFPRWNLQYKASFKRDSVVRSKQRWVYTTLGQVVKPQKQFIQLPATSTWLRTGYTSILCFSHIQIATLWKLFSLSECTSATTKRACRLSSSLVFFYLSPISKQLTAQDEFISQFTASE